MKKLIIVLAIFSSNTYGQILPESIVKQATGESIRISKILKIAIRPNLYRDSPVQTTVNKGSSTGSDALNSNFVIKDTTDVIGGLSDTFRYYLQPIIIVGPLAYKIVTKQIDTNKLMYYEAMSILIHEFTHDIQITNVLDHHPPVGDDSVKMRNYMSQSDELESYAVQSYYLLENLNKKQLRMIMSIDIDSKTRMKMLINAYYKIVYPWHKGVILPINA